MKNIQKGTEFYHVDFSASKFILKKSPTDVRN